MDFSQSDTTSLMALYLRVEDDLKTASKGQKMNKELNKMPDTKTAGDPLAKLKEMRQTFSADEDRKDLVTALDKEIATIEAALEAEKQEYTKRLADTENQAVALKAEVDGLKAVAESQKQEFAKIAAMLEAEKTAKRKAEFETLVGKLAEFAYPTQIEILRKIAEEPKSGDPVFKFSSDSGEVTKSFLELAVDLLMAVPVENRPKALAEPKTVHKAAKESDMDRVKLTLTGFEYGKKAQNVTLDADALKKMVADKEASLVAPE